LSNTVGGGGRPGAASAKLLSLEGQRGQIKELSSSSSLSSAQQIPSSPQPAVAKDDKSAMFNAWTSVERDSKGSIGMVIGDSKARESVARPMPEGALNKINSSLGPTVSLSDSERLILRAKLESLTVDLLKESSGTEKLSISVNKVTKEVRKLDVLAIKEIYKERIEEFPQRGTGIALLIALKRYGKEPSLALAKAIIDQHINIGTAADAAHKLTFDPVISSKINAALASSEAKADLFADLVAPTQTLIEEFELRVRNELIDSLVMKLCPPSLGTVTLQLSKISKEHAGDAEKAIRAVTVGELFSAPSASRTIAPGVDLPNSVLRVEVEKRLEAAHSLENADFLKDIAVFAAKPDQASARKIIEVYIEKGADKRINVAVTLLNNVLEKFSTICASEDALATDSSSAVDAERLADAARENLYADLFKDVRTGAEGLIRTAMHLSRVQDVLVSALPR